MWLSGYKQHSELLYECSVLLKNAAKKVKLGSHHENHTEMSTIPAAKPPTRSSAAISKPATAKPPALTKKTSQVKGVTGRGTVGTGKVTGAGKVTAGAKTKAGGRSSRALPSLVCTQVIGG